MRSIRAYIELMRPVNSIGTGLGIVFATLVYSEWTINTMIILIGFLTGLLGTAAAMTINDVVDAPVDSINKPWKPIPSGRVKPGRALILGYTLITIAVTINVLIGWIQTLIALIYAVIAVAYSYIRRYWYSQLLVPLATTTPVVYGYSLTGFPPKYLVLALGFSLTIYLAVLGREILKAIMDIKGDEKQGYSTIPIRYGVKSAAKTMVVIAVIAPATGILTGYVANTAILYHVFMIIASAIYVYSILRAYGKISDTNTLEASRRKTLYALILGLVAFLFSNYP
ncbi:MAG: geranylgeranylglycerol-phosphate geranylgeranyltransferase [Thermoprotei archaeon]